VLANALTMVKQLQSFGYDIVSGGTDNHLLMIDLRKEGVDGARVELICNEINLYVNKNTVPGDKSALVPHGLRLGR
jgi:glycine hydroxymethyltransferase